MCIHAQLNHPFIALNKVYERTSVHFKPSHNVCRTRSRNAFLSCIVTMNFHDLLKCLPFYEMLSCSTVELVLFAAATAVALKIMNWMIIIFLYHIMSSEWTNSNIEWPQWHCSALYCAWNTYIHIYRMCMHRAHSRIIPII